jgi:hypothetical protein
MTSSRNYVLEQIDLENITAEARSTRSFSCFSQGSFCLRGKIIDSLIVST